MPGISKHGKGSKKRGQAAGSAHQNFEKKKDDLRSQRRRSNRSGANGNGGTNGFNNGHLRCLAPQCQPSLAELERMFDEDSDEDPQVNNPNRDIPPANPVAPTGPRRAQLEVMFESDGVIELQVISTDKTFRPDGAQIYVEGHGGLVLPSRAELERMFEGGNDVELQVINPNEDSGDAHGSE